MPRQSPFKHHRFPREIILCAVRCYLRYPLSYQDVVDLLAERGELGSLHKSDIIVRFVRTNQEPTRHREDRFSAVA